jgi:acetyltransferase-like isoleucine patch superfamily enzyme
MADPRDPFLRGAKNRLFQVVALYAPGADTFRVRLHRARGVRIGEGTFISTGALLETAFPELVWIGSNVLIGIRAVVIAHFRDGLPLEEIPPVRIEDDVFVGPGAIVLPRVTIGRGAVVAAGSVVTQSVAPMTLVQGNPAVPVARCGVPLGAKTPYWEFLRHLRALEREPESSAPR